MWDDPDLVQAFSALAQVVVAVVAALVGGGWAVRKWLAERRDAEQQRLRHEQAQLEQRREEEHNRRAERAAALMSSLGAAGASDEARRWSASALALYPDEAMPVLINALGQALADDRKHKRLVAVPFQPEPFECYIGDNSGRMAMVFNITMGCMHPGVVIRALSVKHFKIVETLRVVPVSEVPFAKHGCLISGILEQ
jgi:type II secretory pathway pseudopilin PulG